MLAACIGVAGCSTIDSIKSLWADDEVPDNGVQREQTPRVQIEVTGIDDTLAANVRALLALAAEACDAPEWRVQREFARSEVDVRRALRALGYYRPSVDKQLVQSDGCWRASYTVEAGQRAQFGDIDVRIEGPGADDQRFGELLAELPVTPGEPLDHGRYEGLKSAIQSIAAERGFFDGEFVESELRVDVDAGRADVTLVYRTGPRYRLGDIRIEQDAFDNRLIARMTQLRGDAPYDSAELAAQNQRYNDSGYFSRVDISPRLREAQAPTEADTSATEELPDQDGKSVPVDIRLTPRPKHAYSAGLGYATDTGPRLRLGYENRRLNQRGHRWDTEAAVSTSDSQLALGYRIPLEDPRTDWLTLQTGYRFQDTKTFETRTTMFGVNRTGIRSGWLETQSLAVTYDDFTVGGIDNTTLLTVPGISWQRSDSDNPLRPERGWSARLELRGAHEALLSDTSFIQARVRGTGIYALPWQDRLIGRLEFGATAVTDFDVLPPDYRFFTGGDTSIRGYAFEALGPKDADGLVVGGRYMAVGSIEYEHPVADKWGVAAFIDAGNAYDDFNEGIKVGVGAGVRWQTPVGPLRLDIGIPLDDDETSFRLHVRFGPDL